MITRTKFNPLLCWVIGWSQLAHAAVLILSAGMLTTRFPLAAATWAARQSKDPR